jgi:pimeloyl-ACP methyl ester carboxylesterase
VLRRRKAAAGHRGRAKGTGRPIPLREKRPAPGSDRPAALLLPGLDGSGRLYAPLLDAGPRAFRPEVVSYPPDEPLGYDDLVARVRARLPRGRFVLLAESFSGPIAVRLAAERPAGLEALVLAATFLHAPLDPVLHPIRGLVGARLFGFPMPAAVVAHRSAEALRVDVREDLARVEVPVLLVAPTRDRLIRSDVADEVLAIRPDAEVALLDAPHMVLQRCPHAALARIEEFLASPGARAGTVA